MLDVPVAATMRPKRIAVDWDSTLATEVWPGIGEWLPGAQDALRRLAQIYDEVVIFTLRVAPVDIDEVTPRDPHDQVVAIGQMLTEAEIPTNVYIWDKPYKPPCEYFIDDRNISFNGDWAETLAQLGMRRLFAKKPVWAIHAPFACQCAGSNPSECPGYRPDTNRKEESVEEAPVWIDQDTKLCAPSVHLETEAPEDVMRRFETGATRNVDADQLDYEGFLSPLALKAFSQYMHENRVQADGSFRDSDNWQKGIPLDSYMKSLIRHVMDLWLLHDGYPLEAREESLRKTLSAIFFNVQGYLHEIEKARVHPVPFGPSR